MTLARANVIGEGERDESEAEVGGASRKVAGELLDVIILGRWGCDLTLRLLHELLPSGDAEA